jgi:hypothetical protein
METDTHGTTANYFAVLGPRAPWGKNFDGAARRQAGDADQIMLIELPVSETLWMEPWDPTLDQLLDILRPEGGNSAAEIMYLTVGGDVRTVDPKTDRESLRK